MEVEDLFEMEEPWKSLSTALVNRMMSCKSVQELEVLKVKVLGKKGLINLLFKKDFEGAEAKIQEIIKCR